MGFWRSLIFGEPTPAEALEAAQAETFAVDASTVDPAVFGLTSYTSPIAPAARISRREAEQVAAVKRSRDLIAGSLGTLPLVTVRQDLTVDTASWLTQPERDVPRSVTMSRTIADLFYEGIAWWKVTAFAWNGYPSEVVRLDPRSVDVLKDGRVHVTGDGNRGMADEWPKDSELIRFDSPNAPLLVAGARAIRQCLLLDTAAQRYADGSPPLDYFTPEEGVELDPDEIRALLDDWQTARQSRATGFVPRDLKYNLGGWNPEQLELAAQRQHAVLEIARVAGVDPEELGVSTTTRTYSNQFDRRKAFIDFTLGGYRAAVEDRLSMGDVTPRGTLVRFDFDAFLRSDAKTRWEAAEVGIRVGAITREEVRAGEQRPALDQAGAEPAAPQSAEEDTVSPNLSLVSFDVAPTIRLDAPGAQAFEVDAAKRTISGLLVPYGSSAFSGGKRFQFARGTLTFSDASRVKLWIQHDPNRAVGRALTLDDRDDGLYGTFQVARGAAGDEALSMAEDGVWDGFSIGLGQGGKFALKAGVHHAVTVPLMETSLTPSPSFDDARVHAVAASAATRKEPTMGDEHDETLVDEAPDFAALTAGLTEAITAGFANLRDPQGTREVVSAGGRVEVREELPYRFDGGRAAHSFSQDIRDAYLSGDTEARQRLDTFLEEAWAQFAVTTGNVSSLNPTQNRPELFVPNLDFSRPLWELVTTGVVDNVTPFTVPKFSSASGLVGNHTQGVEPTPGAYTATVQTITPAPMSGKIEINREVWDQGGSPQADGIIWAEMLRGYFEAIEAKIAVQLSATATTELNLGSAVDQPLAVALTNYLAGLQFVRGGNRFTAFAADDLLFPALVNAKDGASRPLFPVLGPANAQGTVDGAFDRVQIGNLTVRAAWALATANGTNKRSFNFVPSSVYCWASAPKKFTFEYQVKSIDMAIWGYAATAILRDSDVKPIDYAVAD